MATREPIDCYHDAIAAALDWRWKQRFLALPGILVEPERVDADYERIEKDYNEWLEIEAAYYGIEI